MTLPFHFSCSRLSHEAFHMVHAHGGELILAERHKKRNRFLHFDHTPWGTPGMRNILGSFPAFPVESFLLEGINR